MEATILMRQSDIVVKVSAHLPMSVRIKTMEDFKLPELTISIFACGYNDKENY